MKYFSNFKSIIELKNQSIFRFKMSLIFLFLLQLFMNLFSIVSAKEIEQGLTFETKRYQHHRYVEVTLSLDQLKLSQHWLDPKTGESYASLNSFNQAISQNQGVLLFAINSGIYTKEYAPLGLYIENKQLLAPLNLVKSNEGQGNFALLPNGVFYLTDKNQAYVTDTDSFHRQFQGDYRGIENAVQSGPMLLINGEFNPHFLPKSNSLRIRSGVCAVDNGRKVTFVVSEDRVNFYTFASYFKEQVKCRDALYLDGTLARMYVNNRVYGASFWQAKPLVGIWSVIQR